MKAQTQLEITIRVFSNKSPSGRQEAKIPSMRMSRGRGEWSTMRGANTLTGIPKLTYYYIDAKSNEKDLFAG